MTRLHDVFLVLTTAGLLIGCGQHDNATAGSIAKLEVIPAQATIKPQGRQRFSAVATDRNGTVVSDAVLQWRSTDPAVVSVDDTGLATGLSEGAAQVGVSQSGAGAVVSPMALASLRVTQNAARPVEIINLVPYEDQVIFFPTTSNCQGPCPGFVQVAGVFVNFLFSNGDVAESARLVLNNTDVTGGVQFTAQFPAPSLLGEGRFFYVWPQVPPPGTYNVTVELRSKQGKVVTYSWSFTVG